MLILNVPLDSDEEKQLAEIISQEQTSSTELVKELLRDRWLLVKSRRSLWGRLWG